MENISGNSKTTFIVSQAVDSYKGYLLKTYLKTLFSANF